MKYVNSKIVGCNEESGNNIQFTLKRVKLNLFPIVKED